MTKTTFKSDSGFLRYLQEEFFDERLDMSNNHSRIDDDDDDDEMRVFIKGADFLSEPFLTYLTTSNIKVRDLTYEFRGIHIYRDSIIIRFQTHREAPTLEEMFGRVWTRKLTL